MNTELKPDLEKAKKLNTLAWIVSIAVMVLVVVMRQIKIPTTMDFSFLPAVNATLNTTVAILLALAFYNIKKKNIKVHQMCINGAILLSVLFLLSYVVYHFTTEEVRFQGEGTIRYVYFFFLITHVILAAGILPFILFTYIRAYTNQFEKHRAMAKKVFPIWFYVAVTGPICYYLLYQVGQ